MDNFKRFSIVLFTLTLLSGCASSSYEIATPSELAELNVVAIPDNSGVYMSPITSDNVPAEWVDNSINASIGAGVGSTTGAIAGSQALQQIPFIGGLLGSQVGEFIGREAALAAAGGEEFIKESSDLSFNSLEYLSVYLYANYGENPNYPEVLEAASEVYTDLKTANQPALIKASETYRNSIQSQVMPDTEALTDSEE